MDDKNYLLYDKAKSLKYTSLLKCRAIKSDSERERGYFTFRSQTEKKKSDTKFFKSVVRWRT